jgi:hypothetical protein
LVDLEKTKQLEHFDLKTKYIEHFM